MSTALWIVAGLIVLAVLVYIGFALFIAYTLPKSRGDY